MRTLLLPSLVGCLLALVLSVHAGEISPLTRPTSDTIKRLNESLLQQGLPPVTDTAIGWKGDSTSNQWMGLQFGNQTNAAKVLNPPGLKDPLSAADAALVPDKDSAIAKARGISRSELRKLRDLRGLSSHDVLTISTPRLREGLEEIEESEEGSDKDKDHDRDKPRPDDPQGYLKYRQKFLVDETGKIPAGAVLRAFAQAKKMPLNPRILPAVDTRGKIMPNALSTSGWTWNGPGNIGGRIRSMVIHPTQTNRMWVGSVGGGIWYSSDSGVSWSPVNDFMANLAVSTMVIDPTNPQTMYAGTGEGFYNVDGIRGLGIFKSTDGGVTWNQLSSTNNSTFYLVNRLAISPDGTTLLAALSSGIYRSINGGTSWTQTLSSSNNLGDVEFHPTDSTKAVASGYGHLIYCSTNGGASFTAATTGPSGGTGYNGGRIEVRYAKSNPSILYAAFDFGGSQLYKSTDGGVNYSVVNTNTPNWLSTQGWYANALWIDPTNSDLVVVGGLDIYRSTNGGVAFTKISNWQNSPTSAHADHHGIVNDPGYNGTTNTKVYFTNDGGVYRASNVLTVTTTTGWQELNNNLGITQFYGAGVGPTGKIVAGAQDNGTVVYTPANGTENWATTFGGDGGACAADSGDANYLYGEYVYLEIHRSTNGGSGSSYIYTGITDAGSSAEFIAPFILDPNNMNTMLAGGTSLWRSTNVKASTPSWASIKASISQDITAIAVAPGNSDVIYVGYVNGAVYKTTNGTATTPTWTQVGSGTLPARRADRFAIDPRDSNHVVVAYGGFLGGDYQSVRTGSNLWVTGNGGTSWTSIQSNLPAAPIYTVAFHPDNSNYLYVGTDVGVFATVNAGSTWSGSNVGPSTAPVVELLFTAAKDLVAVTHGRGVFQTTSVEDAIPPTLVITPDTTPTNASPITFRFQWSESVTGFTASSVSVTNGTKGTFSGSGSLYSLAVTPSGSSPVSVSVAAGAAQDLTGNTSTAASSASAVTYDAASPFLFSTAFDGTSAPQGWTVAGASWVWGTPTSGPGSDHTGSGKCFATNLTGTYANGVSTTLTTPIFDVPSASSLPYRLRFWMWLSAESGHDGGNVEISVNGGAFSTVTGSSFDVPYNGSGLAVLPGGAGWTGATYASWTRVRLDLSSYVGQSVQFRFRFASDGSVNFPGWYIDDLTLEQDPQISLAASPAIAVEGGAPASVNLSLFPKAPSAINVGVTAGGTAVAGTDYPAITSPVAVSANASSASFNISPTADGNTQPRMQTVVLALSGGAGYTVGSPNTATVILLGADGYDAWRSTTFTATQLADASISGPNATPANDGVTNLMKFGLGLNPFVSSSSALPKSQLVTVSGSQYLQIQIVRPAGLANLTYTGEVSGDLQSWSSSGSAVSTTVTAGPLAGQETVVYRDLTPVGNTSGAKRFLRLRITTN